MKRRSVGCHRNYSEFQNSLTVIEGCFFHVGRISRPVPQEKSKGDNEQVDNGSAKIFSPSFRSRYQKENAGNKIESQGEDEGEP